MWVKTGHEDTNGEGHLMGTHGGEKSKRVRATVHVGGAVMTLWGVLWVFLESCFKDAPCCQKPSVSMILEDKFINALLPTALLQGRES